MRQVNLDSSADFSQNFFNHNNLPSISAFPKDENSWRIDWFGDVAFPNRLLRRTQPSVLVHLSRVLDNSFRDNPAVLLSPESTFASKQRKAWVSVGTLPLLRIGDVWRNGQQEMCPDYELEHFPDLEINSETTVLIKAGLNLEEKGFLLPRSEHPWHMQCTQSYCLMVELPRNCRLIIPCVELIRFYFGSSSNLLTKLFLPPLKRDALYSKPHVNKVTGRLTLQLAPNISGVSAVDIGVSLDRDAEWAERDRLEQLARERRELERQAAAERQRLKEVERQRRADLVAEAENWKRATLVREYITAVRERAVDRTLSGETKAALDAWISWAEHAADTLDPLASRVADNLPKVP